jgi:ABC-type multidrug transport system fused ATPase/permease subunit
MEAYGFYQRPFVHHKEDSMTDSILEVGYKSPTTYREVFAQITNTLKACWTLSASQRRYMLLAYGTTLIIEGVSVIAPWLSSKLMARIAGHELHFQMADATYILAGIWVCWLSWGILDGIRDAFNQHFRNNLNRDLPLIAQERLLSLSRDFHQTNNTGQLTAKVVRGAEKITDVVDLFQHNILPRTTVLMIVLVMLGWINIWFAITGAALIFVYSFLIIRGRTKTQKLYDDSGDLEERADALTGEAITNVSVVQAFHQESDLLKRTYDLREKRRDLKDQERSINLVARTVRAILADQTGWFMLLLSLFLFQAHNTSFQLLVFTVGLINRFRDEIVQAAGPTLCLSLHAIQENWIRGGAVQ